MYRLGLPAWLFRKSAQILLHTSNGSWGLTVRVYNRLGPDAVVFNAAEYGDWDQVQQMLATGQASPYDVDQYDRTLLNVAAREVNPEACGTLVKYGLDPARPSALFHLSPVEEMMLYQFDEEPNALEEKAKWLEVFSLLARASPESFIEDDESINKLLLCYSPQLVSAVIESVSPSYGPIDPTQRVLAAFHHSVHIETMDLLLGTDLSMHQAFEMARDHNNYDHPHIHLLCNIAGKLGNRDLEARQRKRCLNVLRDIVEFEAQNMVPHRYKSPLKFFLYTYIRTQPPRPHDVGQICWNEYFTNAARTWLSLLVQAGANLETHGAAEQVLIEYMRADSSSKFRQFEISTGRRQHIMLYIQGITWGPNVNDWNVFVAPTPRGTFTLMYSTVGTFPARIVDEVDFEMAADFWNWVENPELFNVPGSFIDVDDKDGEQPVDTWGGKSVLVSGPVL